MKKIINYIKHNWDHKISFWKIKNLKAKLFEYGPTFLTILIIIELLEHIGLPILFSWLGLNVHEAFLVAVPAPFIFCLHFITAPIVFFIYIRIKKKKYSEFKKNILKLLTTISFAQLIPLIITPLLTQYFSAEEFGLYGLYISICSILGVIAAGRYDLAIMLPKKNKDAINIVAIGFFLSIASSFLFLIILTVFKNTLFEITRSELFIKYYFFIPISILIISFNQIFMVWFNRQKNYSLIGDQNLLKSTSNSFSSLFLGIKSISLGMIIGNIISLFITVSFNIYDFLKSSNTSLINRRDIVKNFKKYIIFLKYSTISNLFNSLSSIGLTLLIAIFFGTKIAGFYFLAERIISIPISIVTNSVSQVYFQKASTLFYSNKKELFELTVNVQKKIFYILFPFLFIISVFGGYIFSIFGNEWIESGLILKYFAIFILFKNLYSPISTIGDILKKQKLLLFFNISLFFFQLCSFYFLKEYGDIKPALLLSSIFGAIHYIILNIYMRKKIICDD